ncbi:pancreas/duodenum homeobox protein 1-like [Lampris incognitus]|uniref:pancreas/duodenum homeobox protein 1-like n=1 Tax=Lampris incognitus TaxID=2546036 RepID=UPI0024B54D8E|nr:pancreas/duodenum homeobox protein 1-like [Lampris incognitus]
MNREEHYFPPQVFKDSCAYQRSQGEDYSHSPPPCLYMGRQVHSAYAAPSMGALDPASLPDVTPYGMALREEPGLPQLHHPQTAQQQQQQPPQPQQPPLPPPPTGGYGGDTGQVPACADRSRYHLPFPWMKSTKSHAHSWRGQWAV